VRRTTIGFVFRRSTSCRISPRWENVQVPLFWQGRVRANRRIRPRFCWKRVGLTDRLDHKPSELSVGQQQRVALARMLANDPAVILADEPTGNLDPDTSETILAFLEG